MRVSIVTPCYNEEESVALLAERVGAAARRIVEAGDEVEVVFVDDGSSDSTVALLTAACETLPSARVVEHGVNRGLGAAMRTGMAAATGDAVVTLDADCTYDPVQIPEMLALLADADVVLGSPYHPDGATANVPIYRLALSRTLSGAYRAVLRRRDLNTFTSIFRAYTADAVSQARSRSDDYLALTEMLVSFIDAGLRIVEYPTVLHVRVTGASKLRILRMIRRHALMVARLALGGGRRG